MIEMKTVAAGATGRSEARHLEFDSDRAVDEALAESFPASDPPSWNPGGAVCAASPQPVGASHDVVVVTGDRRTARQWATTMAGALGVALLVPTAILIVGVPIMLAVRVVVAVATWLTALA
jgi:hypothetical protein